MRDADKGAPRHARDGVAGGADFAIDLKATAEAGVGGVRWIRKREMGFWDARLVVEGFVPFLVFPWILDRVKSAGEMWLAVGMVQS